MTTLLVLGAGGHAKVAAETALASGAATQVVFLDDRWSGPESMPKILGRQVIGTLNQALNSDFCSLYDSAMVAIGNPSIRLHWLKKLQLIGYRLPVLIHPTASISPSAKLGPGSVVFAQAAVQADACIGCGVILNTGSSVDHDVQLSDGVHICPGARLAGHVSVGLFSWIGIGASVIQGVRIGSGVTIGAGSVVHRDLPSNITAVGVPARVLASN